MKSRRRRYYGTRNVFKYRVGIAWFEPEAYARLQRIMAQPHPIAWTYEVWRQDAESRERDAKRRGSLAVRVNIDPEEFLAWTKARAVLPNGDALKRYVGEKTWGDAF